jgi:hypothetical protein
MKDFEKNITFAIVCHRGESEIDKNLESIDPNIRVIIVENSNNISIKYDLEKKFSIIWKFFGKK